MTEAGWTREKPSKEGVYWFRWTVNSNSLIVSVAKDDCDWRVLEMGHQYDGTLAGYGDGEWLGPITPDSYQQGRVACLGDVKRYVERQIKIGEDFIGGPDPNIQRRVALGEVIEYCDRQLAQQAQEGGVGDGNSTKV